MATGREAAPFRLELWDAQYGPEVSLEGDSLVEALSGEVETDLELPFPKWRPLSPKGPPLSEKLIFIDGVRRIEERVVLPTTPIVYGALGSYAVGSAVVSLSGRRAAFGPLSVKRFLILGGGRSAPPFRLAIGIEYEPVSDTENTPEMPPRKLQELMRLGEERLAHELMEKEPEALLILDGPLAFSLRTYGAAIGYIKRITRFYLPDPAPLRHLPAGTRTPIFGFKRPTAKLYSWFLRLTEPRWGESPWAGLVRLEVSQSVGMERARQLADFTTFLLPRFRGQRGRDPRAPQNLKPVGALEKALYRRLGDEKLLRRAIYRQLYRAESLPGTVQATERDGPAALR